MTRVAWYQAAPTCKCYSHTGANLYRGIHNLRIAGATAKHSSITVGSAQDDGEVEGHSYNVAQRRVFVSVHRKMTVHGGGSKFYGLLSYLALTVCQGYRPDLPYQGHRNQFFYNI